MSLLEFTKMHGIGNDYIYVDCRERTLKYIPELAIKLSDRHFGIGSDGLVLIMNSDIADFRMRMFNADGSEGEMCGNAVRCIAKYLYEKAITSKDVISLETLAGIKTLYLLIEDGFVNSVRVDMGQPALTPAAIPVNLKGNEVKEHSLTIGQKQFSITCVSMGNPHTVIFVDEITDKQVLHWGPQIETHELFPQKTNVEFAQVLGRDRIKMRVWERGSGETLACGTGACATAVAAIITGRTDRNVTIELTGGDLNIEWHENNHVFKTGPAAFSFEGTCCV